MRKRQPDARTEKLFVRLTPEEMDVLRRLAEEEDRPVSSVVRLLLRTALRRPEKS